MSVPVRGLDHEMNAALVRHEVLTLLLYNGEQGLKQRHLPVLAAQWKIWLLRNSGLRVRISWTRFPSRALSRMRARLTFGTVENDQLVDDASKGMVTSI